MVSPVVPPSYRRDPSWARPGRKTEKSGVYRVYHYAHRLPHEVFIDGGTVLPPCRVCGELVQFAPLITAEPFDADVDFQSHPHAAAEL